jgi:myosin protein heavy chain
MANTRRNPFSRESPSPAPAPLAVAARPKSMAFTPSPSQLTSSSHNRNSSFSPPSSSSLVPRGNGQRNTSHKTTSSISNTFAPRFIKAEEAHNDTERVKGIEGENDFSGKRYVWIKDPQAAFLKGWVVQETASNKLLVQCEDGSVEDPMLNV